MKTLTAAFSAALVAGLVAGASAQELRGTLRDKATGRPLSQGLVELLTPEGEVVAQSIADENGLFVLSANAAGAYQVRGSRLDAETLTDGPVELAQGQVLEVDFLLMIDAIELDAIDVNVRGTQLLRDVGFYLRETISSGTFVTREEILSLPNQTTTDVLARAPGVQVHYRDSPMFPTVMLRAGAIVESRYAVGSGGGRQPRCLPRIYLDALPVQQGGDTVSGNRNDRIGFFDLQSIRPDQILGIEIYSGGADTPAQFSGGSAGCGVIVIWTR